MKHKILLVLLLSSMALYHSHCSKGFNGFPAGETGEGL